MSHVTELADRLTAIDWDASTIEFAVHRRSRVALMREYLRRAAWWADRYKAADDWPFFDIAALVDQGVRADQAAVQQVNASLARPGPWPTVKDTCVWALHFAALLDAGVELPDLPHPFDPLIVVYERGGGFLPGNTGLLEIDLAGIDSGTLQDNLTTQPGAPMTESELDALDR
jgi:hypothetical protein